MSSKVNFKAYLMVDGYTEIVEVKRFQIEVELAPHFVYLQQKLQCVFPNICNKRFVITWEDAEGDQFPITNNEELEIALAETPTNDVRKLYVILHSEEEKYFHTHGKELEGEIHKNIECDGCNGCVRGFRYKCIECANYDLCSECEAKGLHPQHFMLRIAAPQQWSSRGKGFIHHLKKFAKKNVAHAYKEDATRECPTSRRRHGKCSRPNYDGHSWMNVFADYINDWTNYAEECPRKTSTKKPPEQATEAKATTNETSSQEKKREAQPHVDLLKIVEDNIAQLLNPFGIDISVQVKNNKQSESAPSDEQAESQASSNVNEKKNPTQEEETKSTYDEHIPASTASSVSSNQEQHTSGKVSDDDEWTVIDTSKTAIPAPAPSTSTSSVSFVLTPSSSSSTSTHTSSTVTPSNGAIPKQDITPSAPALENDLKKPTYPPLPETEPTFYHPNPKIQCAVETMMQMGFTNEGGWLTQLLIAKNGDIDKALDILQPVNR